MTVNDSIRQVMSKRGRTRLAAQIVGVSALASAAGLTALFGVYTFNNRAPGITIPTPAMPADNGYDDFVRAGKLAKTMRYKSPLDMSGPPEETQTYANYKACAPEAALVEDVMRRGLNKPYQMPPMRSAKAAAFPQFALLREVARVLAGKARYEELSGRPGQAADTLLDGMEMGVTIPRGGNLISGLVGIAVEAISMRPMEEILPRLNEPQLAHVAARLNAIAAKRVAYADIMTEEGNTSLALLQETLRDPANRGLKGMNDFATQINGDPDAKLTWRERLQAIKYLFANKRALLRHHQAYFQALAAEARKPYHGAAQVPTDNDALLQVLEGVFANARDKFVGMEAAMTLLQTEVALQRYRLANGKYPSDLTRMVNTYIGAVPRDICAGAAALPLRYAPQSDGGYLLYSIGPDMRDDGGKPSKYIGIVGGDIVAQHLWPIKMKPVKVPSK